ncbi:MAG: hypothetical protein KGJ60_01330 [Verrucomicrobiota bacterium]|nr:hypothetical protein [Verrucomicrobiota bacterium]
MRTIISTYPGFRSLPKGVKQLLVVSESHFFDGANLEFLGPGGQRPRQIKEWRAIRPENKSAVKVGFGLIRAMTTLITLGREAAHWHKG